MIARALVAIFMLGASLPLAAWNYIDCMGNKLTWATPSASFRLSSVSFYPGHMGNFIVPASINAWNAAPGANFRFAYSTENFQAPVMGNARNEIGFSTNLEWNTLGATAILSGPCPHIAETDILFNANRQWSYAMNPSWPIGPGEPFVFMLVMTHELGHSMGLHHEENALATMLPVYPHGGSVGRSYESHVQPLADDVAGDRAGYGTCCSVRDVMTSAYRVYGSGQNGLIVPPVRAFRGRPAEFTFTVANRGSVNEPVIPIQFYLSKDRYMLDEIWRATATLSIDAGGFYYGPVSITLPLTLQPGSYYFAYGADRGNTIASEADEQNNIAIQGFLTEVPAYTPPVACFTKSAATGPAPLSVSFDAYCSSDPDGTVASYSWSFGDGGTGSGAAIAHVFQAPGTYRVVLTVTDNQGYSEPKEASITAQ
jgi:PKD domain/CARDB/Matrixin